MPRNPHEFLFERQEKINEFRVELEKLINRLSLEQHSNTPDYVIADHLVRCLHNYNETCQQRERHEGKPRLENLIEAHKAGAISNETLLMSSDCFGDEEIERLRSGIHPDLSVGFDPASGKDTTVVSEVAPSNEAPVWGADFWSQETQQEINARRFYLVDKQQDRAMGRYYPEEYYTEKYRLEKELRELRAKYGDGRSKNGDTQSRCCD